MGEIEKDWADIARTSQRRWGTDNSYGAGPTATADPAPKQTRLQALREVLELIGAIKLKYAIFGRPDDGQLEKAITEIEAKLKEKITQVGVDH